MNRLVSNKMKQCIEEVSLTDTDNGIEITTEGFNQFSFGKAYKLVKTTGNDSDLHKVFQKYSCVSHISTYKYNSLLTLIKTLNDIKKYGIILSLEVELWMTRMCDEYGFLRNEDE